jgi:hypothetical protein
MFALRTLEIGAYGANIVMQTKFQNSFQLHEIQQSTAVQNIARHIAAYPIPYPKKKIPQQYHR